MREGAGHNICINMRLAPEDLARLEEEKERTQCTTSTVISSAIERGFKSKAVGGKQYENK